MLRKFLILLMAAFSSTFALRRVERRSSSESEEMNMFHDIIREQLASIYQDLYPMEETVSPSLAIIKVRNLTKEPPWVLLPDGRRLNTVTCGIRTK